MAEKRAAKPKTKRGSKPRTGRKPSPRPARKSKPEAEAKGPANNRDYTAELDALVHLTGGDFELFIERARIDVGFVHEPDAIAAVNALKSADYARLAARLKKETEVRIAPFEAALRAAKGNGADPGDDGLPGKPLTFDAIEPWPDPVDGAELLTELSGAIGSYVVMSKHQCDAAALWAIFTHAHDLRDNAPPFVIKSPAMRSGKTKLLETFERLVPRPLLVSGITAAFLERAIEAHRPTLLIDEYDALTSNDPALAEKARAQLNRSSRRRGARVGKSVPLPGGGYESRMFSTWAPTAIAGIGKAPPTVEDRSVPVDLRRKLSTETVSPLRDRDGGDLVILARKIARFVADNEETLRRIEPHPALAVNNDRAKDMWEPLLAIADVAGGVWPNRARTAGKALVEASEAQAAAEATDILLFTDIRDIFARLFPPGHAAHEAERTGRPDDGPRLLSKQLLDELHALDERPWLAWGKSKESLTSINLASLLRPYGIHSRNVRSEDAKGVAKQGKGYLLRSFKDAFSRYIPTQGLLSRPNVPNAANAGENEGSEPSQRDSLGRVENPGNTSNSGVWDVGTAPNHKCGGTEGNDDNSEGAL